MYRTNAIRNLSLSLLLAAGAFAAPAYSQINFNINLAPPAPQKEIVPTVPPGNVWAPGYWGWSGERYVWIRGRPILQRQGFLWQPDHWDQRDGKFFRTAGHWERDKDFKPVKVKKQKNGNHGHDKGKHRGHDKHGD